jgi:hypothetical protein
VPIDIRAVLHRVIDDVFDQSTVTKEEDSSDAPHAHRVLLSTRPSVDGRQRNASLVASYEWFQAHILDLDVHAMSFDYDDDEAEKENEIRDLAYLVRAYLQGEGTVTYRPSLIRRRPVPTLMIETNGLRWRLRRSTHTVEPL